MNKRILVGVISGALLGIICIVGASLRNPDVTNTFLFAFWFNRVVMGLAIGMLTPSSKHAMIIKGLILGTVISFAFYSSTEFQDLLGFLAGIVYGILIALSINLYETKKIRS